MKESVEKRQLIQLSSSLAKLPCPIVILLESFLADTGSNCFQACSEILEAYGPDFVHLHSQDGLS